ncbi:MAG TPA: hypothetical protein VJS12_10765 [Steroidobacteraceae bacterium]|nr:hypothetical protein [Steroidobacteraceae bacterium]
MLAVALTAASALACRPTPDTFIQLVVDSSDAAVIAETERVLLKRFDDEYPGVVEAKTEGSVITVAFRHTTPDRELVHALYAMPGRLRATIPDLGAILFTTRDIADANIAYREKEYMLRIKLVPAAKQRIQRLTTQAVGNIAQLEVDGHVWVRATISSPMSDSMQVPLPGATEVDARALSIVLRSGAHLPAQVSQRAS